jgi:histidyl-tRNA synthetase
MMQSLPGFRDFFPEEFAKRNYILTRWRQVARQYGFIEMDGPVLESIELYEKKNESGAEILTQLYSFEDRGGRRVALRPEMTPTLARMVIARERHYRKPLKSGCANSCNSMQTSSEINLRAVMRN